MHAYQGGRGGQKTPKICLYNMWTTPKILYVLIKMRVKFFAIFCQSISLIFFFCQLCVQWRCPAASRDDRNSIEIFDGGDAYSYAFWYLLSNWLFIIGLIPPPSQTPPQFDQIWNSIWFFWGKIIFIMQTCVFGLIYFIIYFLFWLNIYSNFVTECLSRHVASPIFWITYDET